MDQYRKLIAAVVLAGVGAALQFLPLSDTWRGVLLVISAVATAAGVWVVPNAPTDMQRTELRTELMRELRSQDRLR